MRILDLKAPRMVCVALLWLVLIAAAIAAFSAKHHQPNSLLTGRWLLTLNGAPKAMRYLEFSPSGNVTAYQLDGTTIDMVPGYRETWIVRGNVIETSSEVSAPAKPMLATLESFASRMLSSQRELTQEPARYAFTIENGSTLQMELLDSPTPHLVTLTRVSVHDD